MFKYIDYNAKICKKLGIAKNNRTTECIGESCPEYGDDRCSMNYCKSVLKYHVITNDEKEYLVSLLKFYTKEHIQIPSIQLTNNYFKEINELLLKELDNSEYGEKLKNFLLKEKYVRRVLDSD